MHSHHHAVSRAHAPAIASTPYERHTPETTLLYRTVQEHWRQFLADIEAEGGELPDFVKNEFEAFIRCGILAHGFLRVRCKDCGFSRAVAFACRRRGFCPSCIGRRMADTAAFAVDCLFPRVPVRQFVLSVSPGLRFKMAYSPKLASAVLGCFIAAITSDLRRRARKRKIRGPLQTGALTVIQRFGSSLALNVHFHSLVIDGIYAKNLDGSMLFHPLPAPKDEDVARIARAVCRKVTRLLARQKDSESDQTTLLDEMANASIQGLVATGPRRGCRVFRLGATGEDAEATITGKRCADVAGFNVHANTCAHAGDRQHLEQLVKYLARPPIANERLSELPDGHIILRFKQPWRDGTTSVMFTPHELIEKLIPLVPRPRAHVVRYHGILGPAAKDRDKVVPRSGPVEIGRSSEKHEPREVDPGQVAAVYRLPWAVLLKRVFLTDVLECPKCKGRMKILAAIMEPDSVRRVLRHLGLPTEAPKFTPARPPPQQELATEEASPEEFYPDPPNPDW